MQFPVAGKIRLGIKKESKDGRSEYPSNVPYFVVSDAPGVQEVYGTTPTELHILFFSANEEEIAPYYYKYFSGGYKNAAGKMVGGELKCKGDGCTADYYAGRNAATRIVPTRPCVGPDGCPDGKDSKGNDQCRPELNLYFVLPLVNPYKIFRLDSHSWNNIKFIMPVIKMHAGIDRAQQDPRKRIFTRTVFKLTKYLKEGIKFQDNKGVDKKSDQYLLAIEPMENFAIEYGPKLIERRDALERGLMPSGIEYSSNSVANDQQMITNESGMGQLPPPIADESSQLMKRISDISNEPELVQMFETLANLTGKPQANTEKNRLITARKFEKSADPRSDLIAYLNKGIVANTKREPPPSEPVTPPPTTVAEPIQQQESGTATPPPTNADGII